MTWEPEETEAYFLGLLQVKLRSQGWRAYRRAAEHNTKPTLFREQDLHICKVIAGFADGKLREWIALSLPLTPSEAEINAVNRLSVAPMMEPSMTVRFGTRPTSAGSMALGWGSSPRPSPRVHFRV